MTNNKITFRKLLNTGVVALASATTGLARTPPTGPTPAPAPAGGDTQSILALLQGLQGDALLHTLSCSPYDGSCQRDGALPPVAKDVILQAPRHLTRAPRLHGATHAQGCSVSGTYAVPLDIAGEAEPVPVIFDTGSAQLAVADKSTVRLTTNVTTTLPDLAPPVAAPALALDGDVEETNVTTTQSYGKGFWVGQEIMADVGFAGGPGILDMTFSHMNITSDLLPVTDQCEFDNIVPSRTRGILGMGSRPLPEPATDAFITRALSEDPNFSFSFAPCHRGANLFWQAPPAQLVRGHMAYARTSPLATHSHATDLAYVEVGGERLPFAPASLGSLVFDTGSTLMLFSPSLVYSIGDALARQTGRDAWSVTLDGSTAGLGCFDLPPSLDFRSLDDALPKLTLGVPSADPGEAGKAHRITLSASNYLNVRFGSQGQAAVCAQFGTSADTNIFGVGAMIGHVVHFDEANLRVGIGQGHGTCLEG